MPCIHFSFGMSRSRSASPRRSLSSSSSNSDNDDPHFYETEEQQRPDKLCDVCDNHSSYLRVCEQHECNCFVCADCRKECASCASVFCIDDVRECVNCANSFCESCIQTSAVVNCDNCEAMFCANKCAKLCGTCEKSITCSSCYTLHFYCERNGKNLVWISCWRERLQRHLTYLHTALGLPVDLVELVESGLLKLEEVKKNLWKKEGLLCYGGFV